MNFRFGLCTLLILFLNACGTINRELENYPAEWPKLAVTNCSLPLGVFPNLPDAAAYQYVDERIPMSLEQAFNSFHGSSHLRIESGDDAQYQISLFAVSDTEDSFRGDFLITSNDYSCKQKRLNLVSETTHETFRSYQDPEYSPLYTAAYVVGTFGMGAPISNWWEYRLAMAEDGSLVIRRLHMSSGLLFLIYSRIAMSDDWFIFNPVPIFPPPDMYK